MYNIFAIIHRHQRSQKKLFMHTEMQEKKSKTTQDAPPNQSEIWNRERARQRIYKKWKKLLSNSVCVRLSINLIQFSFFFVFVLIFLFFWFRFVVGGCVCVLVLRSHRHSRTHNSLFFLFSFLVLFKKLFVKKNVN